MADKTHGSNWPWALMNLGIVALVGFALWFTHSLWAFLGLLFLFYTRPSTINAKCPKCDHEFVATVKDDNEDEG
ncbi:MAG: hypothetical protein HY220_03305 [Candidatus Sungbacteria bacterium]|uniref:Uncharacterized protein n=1 Tax=Candidatus Sungiibacteriota bacterium TaxID=2750080 RepID=A0A9D6LRJ6_9BACT|nr:hypothetical protein [Candidatus Sungbacteria bacterium]